MNGISIHNIIKSYSLKKKKVEAVRDISLEVKEGELFGLIGPDGAGKTTLFRILTTLLLPDSGEAFVHGLDVVTDFKKLRKEIGYMPGRFSLYADLTVEENLNFFANVFNTSVKENYELIKDIYHQIEPFKDRRAGKLSGGMKQKLALSCALIHRPKTLFLDEPTTGVDAVSRKEFWELLKSLRAKGITIMVSTPYMDEASLCDRVALIQKGRIMTTNSPVQLTREFSNRIYEVRAPDRLAMMQQLKSMPEVEDIYPFGETDHLVLKKGVTSFAMPEKLQHKEIQPDIEDLFIHLMKQNHG